MRVAIVIAALGLLAFGAWRIHVTTGGTAAPLTPAIGGAPRPVGAAIGDFKPDEIVAVLPRDAIPALVRPRVVPGVAAKGIANDQLVVGVEVAGDARAYPIATLSGHEIVDDELHGRPIAVTW
jgi:hypothetical protein